MSGGSSVPDSAFTGWKYYFNSYTLKGRFNIVMANYAILFAGIAIWRMRSKKKKALEKDGT
ncbi:unnamed protein product [Schistosoma rodhaini]|uniref:Uncharacterized protein n=1 Tax=Schistosoma rodhaini TaxID=6188 RepID=A0AA85FV30_9TREM|nr:unnamed protein product [Schistosoma rodhaini]